LNVLIYENVNTRIALKSDFCVTIWFELLSYFQTHFYFLTYKIMLWKEIAIFFM